jgi:hypothetical protein
LANGRCDQENVIEQMKNGVNAMRMPVHDHQKLIAPRSPWQNPVVERLIGSIRRECLDRIIVFNEEHLRRILTDYLSYYYRHRTHRSLEQDCPQPRAVEPPDQGKIIELPLVCGLHHRYARQAAA